MRLAGIIIPTAIWPFIRCVQRRTRVKLVASLRHSGCVRKTTESNKNISFARDVAQRPNKIRRVARDCRSSSLVTGPRQEICYALMADVSLNAGEIVERSVLGKFDLAEAG